MVWIVEFNTTTPRGAKVEYQVEFKPGNSRAESRDRVRLGSQIVHEGWAADQAGYFKYRELVSGTDLTEG